MMRRMSKKVGKLTGSLAAVLAIVAITGCGSKREVKNEQGEQIYRIGISQFAEHASLDNCREGFLEGLKEEGLEEGKNLKIEVKNAAADMGTASQIADRFVADQMDLICAIATPSAQTAFNAAMDTEIPVIYTAVTDPETAELAGKDKKPAGEVTGTSDRLPIKDQLEMIRQILPEAKKIGILYTTSEVNSLSAIRVYENYAEDYGFEIVIAGVSNTSEIAMAAEALVGKVDCLTNLTDNTVVNSLPTILERAKEAEIPVFGSEIEQVKLGCLAAEGLDYVELGKQTGKMAAKILTGEAKASELEYEEISGGNLYLNTAVAEQLGISFGEKLLENAEICE